MSERLRIIVLGYVIRGPLGGMVWHHLQFTLGLARLGHDVYFVEDSDDYESCYNPELGSTGTDPGYGLAFASRVFARLALGDRWTYYDAHTDTWHGPRSHDIVRRCAEAEIVLNLCGANPLRPWLMGVPLRILLDGDPAFTQIRHLTDPWARERAGRHNAFFTFAENIGHPTCRIPDDGFPWLPMRQALVADTLAATPGPIGGHFTTVMQWVSYPPQIHNGVHYGLKSHSLEPYLDLPKSVDASLELAVAGPSVPREMLMEKGWRVIDPSEISRDPWTYQNYIAQSKAEFSIAKQGYVVSRSGWFSERSVAYLAAGRPVILQDTGFSDCLPVGEGLLAFASREEAIDRIAQVNAHYTRHCRAARALAEEQFGYQRVLPTFLDRAMAAAQETRGQSARTHSGEPSQ